MLALQITDLKKFTTLLFTEDTFDKFLLHDACFVTSFTTNVEGAKNSAFYSEEEREEEMKTPFISWSLFRPTALRLISGKKLPAAFKVVLLTSADSTEAMVRNSGFTGCEVSSLSMNISWQSNMLTLTTGISYKGFSMDKTLEQYWDRTVTQFLSKKEIEFSDQF